MRRIHISNYGGVESIVPMVIHTRLERLRITTNWETVEEMEKDIGHPPTTISTLKRLNARLPLGKGNAFWVTEKDVPVPCYEDMTLCHPPFIPEFLEEPLSGRYRKGAIDPKLKMGDERFAWLIPLLECDTFEEYYEKAPKGIWLIKLPLEQRIVSAESFARYACEKRWIIRIGA